MLKYYQHITHKFYYAFNSLTLNIITTYNMIEVIFMAKKKTKAKKATKKASSKSKKNVCDFC